MKQARARIALALLAVLAAGCSRDEPAPSTPAKGVTGTVSKGPLQSATVDFYNVDIAGNQVGTIPITTVTTNALGQFSVGPGVLPAGVPVLAVTSSGSYVDESDPETNPSLRRTITFSATEHLEAALPPGATTVAITPYSMALLKKARLQANGANFANVYAAVQVQAAAAFGFDPVTTTPADPLTGAGGSQPYGLLLGAAAMTINRIAGTATPARMPAYADVIAFVDDFASPPLDAADLDEMIRRFRNNNIGTYSDTTAPVVDETALAAPAPVPNSAPTIAAIADQSTAEETLKSVGVTIGDAEDPSGNSLTVTATSNDQALLPDANIGVSGTGTSRTIAMTPATDLTGSVTVTVVVTDSALGTATDSFQLDVTQVNDAPVVADQTLATLPENSANATVVGTVAFTDAEGGAMTHSITAGNTGGAFSINSVTGQISVANSAALDFETTPSFTLTVQVQDAGGLSDTAVVTIPLSGANDPPVVNDQSLPGLAENSANGTVVGTLASSDPDAGDTRAHTILAGNTGGAFAVNAASGQVTVANAAALNFEATPSFTLTVQVQDVGGAIDTALVTVALTNVNEAPVVNDQSLSSVAENSANGTVVGTVVASDPDAGDTKAYSITGGNTGGAFAINSSNGQVTVATSAALNFETTPSFTLTVQVVDAGTLSDTALVTIALTNANEAPVVNDQSLPSLAENSANGTVVGTVAASDPDAGDTKSYSITGGNTGGAFAIGATSGQVTVATSAALNFETTPSFTLTVQVADGGSLTDTALVTIALTNVNEAPVAVDDTTSTAEDTAKVLAATTLASNDSDPDGTTPTVTAVSNPINGTVGLVSGTITFTPAGNFSGPAGFDYTLSDGVLTDTGHVDVTVTAVNDAPVAVDDTGSTNEDTQFIVTAASLIANDTDVDGPPLSVFNVGSSVNGAVSLNAGVITFTPSPDFHGTASFTYDVTDGSLLDFGLVTITVDPVNDDPAFGSALYTTSVDENVPFGYSVITTAATDVDVPADTLTYSITAGNNLFVPSLGTTADVFAIDASGLITVNEPAALDYEQFTSFSLTIQVDDGNGGVDTATVDIAVNDLSDTGGTGSLLPYLTGNGDLYLYDPLDPANPVFVDSGLPTSGLVAKTLFTGSVSGTQVSDVRVGRLVYLKGGQVFAVNTEHGQSHVAAQISDIDDACSMNGFAEDIPNPDNSVLRIETAGTDGNCNTSDDYNTGEAWLIHPNEPTGSGNGVQAGVGQCCGSAGITDGSGNLIAVLSSEGDGVSSDIVLNRRELSDLSTVTASYTFTGSGSGSTFSKFERALGADDVYVRGRLQGDPTFRIYRYHVADDSLTAVYDYGVTSSDSLDGSLDHGAQDAAGLYVANGSSIVSIPHGATGLGQHNDLGTASGPVGDLQQSSGHILYEYHGGLSGGVFSLDKLGADAGTPGTQLGADDLAPTVASLSLVDRDRAYITLTGATTFAARITNVDGSGSPTDIADSVWAGGAREVDCDFVNHCNATPALAIILRDNAAGGSGSLEILDPVTATSTGRSLGTLSNLNPGQSSFAEGFGRYIRITAFTTDEQTDIYFGDIEADVAGAPVLVSDVAGIDDQWLGEGGGDDGGPAGPQPPSFDAGANPTLNIAEGSAAPFSTFELNATDPDSPDTAIVFDIVGNPGVGTILLDGSFPTGSFTLDQVQALRIGYQHDGGEAASDSFTFAVRDVDGNYSAECPLAVPCTFTINVFPVNDPPTISALGDQSTSEDTITGTLSYTISDPDDDPNLLSFSATSSDTVLVPNHPAYIILGGSGANRTIQLQPDIDQVGTTTITVTVSDGQYPASDDFDLTVTPVNDVPAQNYNNTMSIGEGGFDALYYYLDFNDVDSSGGDVLFTVTTPPVNGQLEFNGVPVALTSFTLDELRTYQITYRHFGGEAPVDSFQFTVADEFGESACSTATPCPFNISVLPVNDAPTGAVVIDGAVSENQFLGANTSGVSDADGLGTFSYQWSRDGAPIPGETAVTHITGDADVGTLISVTVDYVDGQGNPESLTSAAVGPVANVNDTPTGTVSISGTPTEDQFLSASDTLADNDGIGGIGYEWFRDGVSTGVFGNSYLLGDVDIGGAMSVVASYTDGHGTFESVSSSATAAITNVNDTPFGQPAISGVEQEDSTLTADTTGISDDDGLGVFNYQWQRDNSDIPGETASTYVLGDADVTTLITVVVTYTDGHGTLETVESNPTGFIANVNDAPQGSITILGNAIEDDTLTADGSGITDADGLDVFSYQWKRDGVDIAGETTPNLLLGDADVGTLISVTISYTDARGAAEAVDSGTVGPVVDVNDVPVIDTNNGLSINEGDTVSVTTSDLSASDVEAGELTYNYGPGPVNGVILVNGVPASGSFTQSDLVLGLVSYQHDGSESGSDSFDFAVTDTGTPMMSSAVQTFTITVTSLNDAPINSLPASPVEDLALLRFNVLPGLSVSDAEAGANTIRTTLTVNIATISVDESTGASVTITDNGTNAVILEGAQDQINVVLAGGLKFPNTGLFSINVLTDDLGNSGGPAQQDSDNFSVFVSRLELADLAGDGSGFALAGDGANDFAGRSVASGGDFNADGFDDFVIGASGADGGIGDEGAAYVVYGTASGFPASLSLSGLDGSNGFKIASVQDGDRLGAAVAINGDFNGDGFDDVVLGTEGADTGSPLQNDSGMVWIVYGRDTAFSPMPATYFLTGTGFGSQLRGPVADAGAGAAVAYAGDVNGDGLNDVLVGAPGTLGGSAGAAYVVYGKAGDLCGDGCYFINLDSMDGDNGFELTGFGGGSEAGRSVAAAGDVNGDGLADFLVGAWQGDKAYLVFGSPSFGATFAVTGIDGTNGVVLSGQVASQTGISVAGLDLNGDHFSDVVVGADRADPLSAGGDLDEGAVYVMLGRSDFSATSGDVDLTAQAISDGFVFAGAAPGDHAGVQVANGGDVDGDGLDDLLIGSQLADTAAGTDAGSTSLVFGDLLGFPALVNLSALDGLNGFRITGANGSDHAASAGIGGDFNGDGFHDISIGADLGNFGTGAAFTVYGREFRVDAPAILGTTGHDNGSDGPAVIGTALNESLIGAAGFDFLDGGPGDDVLLGGSGNDRLLFDAADTLRIDGGSGFDRLELPSSTSLDLSFINAFENGHYNRYRNLEAVALDTFSALGLTARDVRGMAGGTLRVDADASSLVQSDDTWRLTGRADTCALEFDTSGLPGLCTAAPYVRYTRAGVNLDIARDTNRFYVPVAFDWTLRNRDASAVQIEASIRPAFSGNGRYVVFESSSDVAGLPQAFGVPQLYRKDLQSNQVDLVTQFSGVAGDNASTRAAISHDGRYVAFRSLAANLGTLSNGQYQVLLWDATSGAISLISTDGGSPFASTGNTISSDPVVLSADGRFIAFLGDSTGTDLNTGDNATHVWRFDTTAEATVGNPTLISEDPVGGVRCSQANPCESVAMSGDGQWVAYSTLFDAADLGDTNGRSDIYLRNVGGSTTTVVTFGADGDSAEPFISGNGQWLAFESVASNLLPAGADTNGGFDIFVYDIASPAIYRASTTSSGAEIPDIGIPVPTFPNGVGAPVLSGDGRVLLYTAVPGAGVAPIGATDLAPVVKILGAPVGNDLSGATLGGHLDPSGAPHDSDEFATALTFDGSVLAMHSTSGNVTADDASPGSDVFLATNPVWIEAGADTGTDSDGDGLSNNDELQFQGTNPLDPDSDDDGLSDGSEVGGGQTLALDADTDDDGVGDGIEVDTSSDPVTPNTVYYVDCGLGLTGRDGLSWTDDSPATGPFGSNADVAAVITGASGSGGLPIYVLYRENTTCGPLVIAGAAQTQFVELVGSVGPTIHQPRHPANTTFDGGTVDRVMRLSNVTGIGLNNLELVSGNANFLPVLGGSGGGLLVDDIEGSADLTLRKVRIANNTGGTGGGMRVTRQLSGSIFVTMIDSLVESNTVSTTGGAWGGGIRVDGGASLGIYASTVRNNTASGLSTGLGSGGGIFAEGASLTVWDSFVTGNAASHQQAAQADGGGGGIFIGNNSVGDIQRTVFANNKGASGPGGGVNAYQANNLAITDSKFLSNQSARPGAGFHLHPTGTNTIVNNLFVGNATTDNDADGGGVEIDVDQPGLAPTVTFNGNTVAWNQTRNLSGSTTGGGISVKQAAGSPATVDLNNDIVYFNQSASGAASNFLWDGSVLLSGSSNDVDESSPPSVANLNFPGLPLDPAFTSGFYLNPLLPSPLIDIGFGPAPSPPYTTDPAGTQDTNPLDIGYHYRSAAVGAFTSVDTDSPPICVALPGNALVFTPRFSNAPKGDPGHLVVVELFGVSGSLDSLTSIDPFASGSRIARDLGDGRYGISIPSATTGTGTFVITVDDLGAQSFQVFFYNSCS